MFSITKKCTKCGETKSISEFSKDKHKKAGYKSWCKSCSNDSMKHWELFGGGIDKKKVWAQENPDKISEIQRRHRNNGGADRQKKWLQDHPEKNSEYSKRWKEKNPDSYRASCKRQNKKRWHENAEKLKEALRKWLSIDSNYERKLKAAREWHKNHPESCKEKNRNRRAQKQASVGRITNTEWLEVLNRYGNRCLYPGCGRADIQMDHVVPLSRGGTHTVENVQPLCSFHNNSKGTKTIDYRK